MAAELKEIVGLAKKRPLSAALMVLLLTGGGGASIGAFATRGFVEEKHSEAMSEISILKNNEARDREQLDRIENKVDRILLRDR